MWSNCKTGYINPHSEHVRYLLNRLIILDNELQCADIALKKAQKNLKQSIDNAIFYHSELKKLACPSEEMLNNFRKNVENINTITESCNKNIADIQNKCKKIVDDSTKLFEEYNNEKNKLKQFYQKTVNYLKSFAILNNDPEIIRKCENDINEINKDFENDILYLKKSENVLCTLFKLLCEKNCVLHLDKHEWQPRVIPTEIVSGVANEIKCKMGATLRKALACLHVHQPLDGEMFLAQYLLHEKRNEETIQKNLERFVK